jgi:hypothetical protein
MKMAEPECVYIGRVHISWRQGEMTIEEKT